MALAAVALLVLSGCADSTQVKNRRAELQAERRVASRDAQRVVRRSLDVQSLEARVRQAIIDFEPRIVPETLHVEAEMGDNQLDRHNVLSLSIRGQLWSIPVPLELLLRTEVDLESGQVQIEDLTR